MSRWRECTLGEIATLIKKTWKVGDKQLPYIGLEHIEESKLRLNGIDNSSAVASNKHHFTSSNILFGKLRPYFRKVIHPKFSGVCSTDIWVIESTQLSDPSFVFYFFANKELIDLSCSASDGTGLPRANWFFLSKTKWSIPPLPEQKAIAEVLSSLDDKIDLLHRQNKTLEAMAETLFRQCFVEEADGGWEKGKLGEVVIPKKGKNITKAQVTGGSVPVIAGGLKPTSFHNQSNTKAPVITISASGANAGFVCLHHVPVWSSDSSYIDNSITKFVYFFYVFLKYNQNVLTDKQEGSAQLHIYPSHIMDVDMIQYPIRLIENYENSVIPFFKKIEHNSKQIQTLETLRDTLLPKLIRGKVRVKY